MIQPLPIGITKPLDDQTDTCCQNKSKICKDFFKKQGYNIGKLWRNCERTVQKQRKNNVRTLYVCLPSNDIRAMLESNSVTIKGRETMIRPQALICLRFLFYQKFLQIVNKLTPSVFDSHSCYKHPIDIQRSKECLNIIHLSENNL